MMVDFKLHESLHNEHYEVGLVKNITRSLYWWVEQCSANALSDVVNASVNSENTCLKK